MQRYSLPLKIGRIYQAVSPALRFMDYPFRLFCISGHFRSLPAIFILAPPRSGSTLLYQLLGEAFYNVHLTNIWNLFYSTPVFGSFVSDRVCESHQSNFKSVNGFVPGICGEAEGMRFWKYWTGQGLKPDESRLKPQRLKKLQELLSKRYYLEDRVWISCYIGHVFCIDFLRQHWENAVFIHLYRDMVSNAYSVYKCSPYRWFSLDPGGIQDIARDRYEEIARQITRVHSIVLDYHGRDVFTLSYEELCESPGEVLGKISDFALKNDVLLREKKSSPTAFRKKKVSRNFNEHTRSLYQYLKEETLKYKGQKRKFFDRMLT